VVAPFEFDLTQTGVAELIEAVSQAERSRAAVVVRVGVEAAGHYHRTVVARLRKTGLEVVELNPGAVKQPRAQQLLRALKSDARDLGAMAELLTRGAGRPPEQRDQALSSQVAWTQHRQRKVKARSALMTSSFLACRGVSPAVCSRRKPAGSLSETWLNRPGSSATRIPLPTFSRNGQGHSHRIAT
jgi:hypothetical protein